MCDPASIQTGQELLDLYRFGGEERDAVIIADQWVSDENVSPEMHHAAEAILHIQTVFKVCTTCDSILIDVVAHPVCASINVVITGPNSLANAYTGLVDESDPEDLWSAFYGIDPDQEPELAHVVNGHRVMHVA